MQLIFARFLSLPIPTLCVISGHCYAGGLFLALCHDFRIMRSGSGRLCLSEINVGLPLPPSYNAVCTELMPR